MSTSHKCLLQVTGTVVRAFPSTHPRFYSRNSSELFQMTPWPRSSSLLRPLLHLIFLKNNLCWMSIILSTPHIHYMKQAQILPLQATSCDICLLWIWHTKLCNQIRGSTPVLYQILQTARVHQSGTARVHPWWHKSFNQLAPFFELFFSVALKEQCH